SPDERLVVAAGADGVRLWDLATDKPVLLPLTGGAVSAIIHPDGKQLFATSRNGLIRCRLEPAAADAGLTLFATSQPIETVAAGAAAVSRSGTLLAYTHN